MAEAIEKEKPVLAVETVAEKLQALTKAAAIIEERVDYVVWQVEAHMGASGPRGCDMVTAHLLSVLTLAQRADVAKRIAESMTSLFVGPKNTQLIVLVGKTIWKKLFGRAITTARYGGRSDVIEFFDADFPWPVEGGELFLRMILMDLLELLKFKVNVIVASRENKGIYALEMSIVSTAEDEAPAVPKVFEAVEKLTADAKTPEFIAAANALAAAVIDDKQKPVGYIHVPPVDAVPAPTEPVAGEE